MYFFTFPTHFYLTVSYITLGFNISSTTIPIILGYKYTNEIRSTEKSSEVCLIPHVKENGCGIKHTNLKNMVLNHSKAQVSFICIKYDRTWQQIRYGYMYSLVKSQVRNFRSRCIRPHVGVNGLYVMSG